MSFNTLAIDLDGTLLVGESLSDRNRDAVAKAAAAGYRIIIATARWRQMAQRISAQIAAVAADHAEQILHAPISACSGAQVYLPAQQYDLVDSRLPVEFTTELFRLCDAHRCIATITVDDYTLLKLDGEPDAALLDDEMRWLPKLEAHLQNPGAPMPRIAAIQGSKVNELILKELKPRFAEQVNFLDSIGPTGKIILTLTATGADKGSALSAICAHADIDPIHVIAFGDSENDLAMFTAAGAAVAMGQADDELKNAATFVTKRNDEDGVAHAIEHLLKHGSLPA